MHISILIANFNANVKEGKKMKSQVFEILRMFGFTKFIIFVHCLVALI